MKRKRLLCAVVSVLLLVSLLTGCGKQTAAQPDEPVQEEAAPGVPAKEPASVQEPEESPAPKQTEPVEAEGIESPADQPLSPPAAGEKTEKSAETSCTVSISCAAVFDHLDDLVPEKQELLPADGVFLPSASVSFAEGESAFDVLKRVCRENKIHMEFSEAPVYQSAYIEGIGNLYEFDCGEGSGWMYCVNGVFPNYGCSQYLLQDGDTVEWIYTCDYGADVGAVNGG